MNIIIPNHLIPCDAIEANRILMEPIDTFQLFYDAQNNIYKKKYAKKLEYLFFTAGVNFVIA
jgi:hypothetical protein